jgi:hypothetical protein
MATAEVARSRGGCLPFLTAPAMGYLRLPERRSEQRNTDGNDADAPTKRKPFANWVKKITNLKGGDEHGGKKKHRGSGKQKKSNVQDGPVQNNPYPASGPLRQRHHSLDSSTNGQLSFATPTSRPHDDISYDGSMSNSAIPEREAQANSNKSGAPTLATNAETIHSDAGHSKAPTATTGVGALSVDGAGAGSTFSSPNHSDRSLTTTLTTIQSQSAGNALQNGASGHHNSHHGQLNNTNPVMFSHQFPPSPGPSSMTASAIPRHVAAETAPNSYNGATANSLLTDNASILTLASSSKRRRRSMDEDASVRAIPPSSVWGGSRESLPLSVLSGNAESSAMGYASQSRPSIGGLASTERASVYSSSGITAPALASERNSYYSHKPAKDLGDAKSLRSFTGMDARSQHDSRSINQFDARSINDAKSMDVNSMRNYEGSVRSGALGHGRNDSIPGSIGSPLASPGVRHPSTSGALSRRSSDWQDAPEEREEEDMNDNENENENDEPQGHEREGHEREREDNARPPPEMKVDGVPMGDAI